ncbi:MAG: hypothetical protein AAGA30_22180 [Planctomycetota bacterium]
MSCLELGELEIANQYRDQLHKIMKLEPFSSDEESISFFEEVEERFDGV